MNGAVRVQCSSPDDAPAGSVFVGRPSAWGNPFRPGETVSVWGQAVTVTDRVHAQVLFIAFLALRPHLVAEARRELAGKDLACTCSPIEVCHASVWLRKVRMS
jgi:hypothetical protein